MEHKPPTAPRSSSITVMGESLHPAAGGDAGSVRGFGMLSPGGRASSLLLSAGGHGLRWDESPPSLGIFGNEG